MQEQPPQELGTGLKSKNSPVQPNSSFFCTELHRGDTTTTLETFQIGTERSMHVDLGQGFPQQMQQPSHSFRTVPCVCGIDWHSCESPVNTLRASQYVKTLLALCSTFLKQYSS